MVKSVARQDVYLMLACLGLALLAELTFFHTRIGIAYLIFIIFFFAVFYIRFQGSLRNKRMGLLIITCLLLITGSYAFFDKVLFYRLNLIVVLGLSLFVIVLMTSSKKVIWVLPALLSDVFGKLLIGLVYSFSFIDVALKRVFKNMTVKQRKVLQQIVLALFLVIPLLVIIISLLMSADSMFKQIVLQFPTRIFKVRIGEGLVRIILVIILTGSFFSVFQALKSETENKTRQAAKRSLDVVFGLTILLLINLIYIMFVIVQFRYLFSVDLQSGLTYAESMRKGYFELLVVTVINWTILITFLKKINLTNGKLKYTMKIMYSILIVVSSMMLLAAFQRLTMYEYAYGYTFFRVQAHALILFLFVIFSYTFIHIWLEGLRMTHFYFIISLLFFTGLNVFHVEQFIASKNWERYEETGEIDIDYLSNLSAAGMDVLIKLYEVDPDYPALRTTLENMKMDEAYDKQMAWQSFNIAKYKTKQKIQTVEFSN